MIRLLDLVFSIFGIIVLLPLMILVAIAVYATDRRAVVFCQTRLGMNGRPFTVYKFRSMTVSGLDEQSCESHDTVNAFSIKKLNDPRVTRVGRIIRKLSIDELPQLINVVSGEMSIVGPRPWVPTEYARMSDHWPVHSRLQCLPGITGLAQINGRSDLSIPKILEYDLDWISRKSTALYFDTIWRTILRIIPFGKKQKGNY